VFDSPPGIGLTSYTHPRCEDKSLGNHPAIFLTKVATGDLRSECTKGGLVNT